MGSLVKRDRDSRGLHQSLNSNTVRQVAPLESVDRDLWSHPEQQRAVDEC